MFWKKSLLIDEFHSPQYGTFLEYKKRYCLGDLAETMVTHHDVDAFNLQSESATSYAIRTALPQKLSNAYTSQRNSHAAFLDEGRSVSRPLIIAAVSFFLFFNFFFPRTLWHNLALRDKKKVWFSGMLTEAAPCESTRLWQHFPTSCHTSYVEKIAPDNEWRYLTETISLTWRSTT